jgi:hypothetical protein
MTIRLDQKKARKGDQPGRTRLAARFREGLVQSSAAGGMFASAK